MKDTERFICQVCGDWIVVGPTSVDQDRLHRKVCGGKVCGGCEDSVPAATRDDAYPLTRLHDLIAARHARNSARAVVGAWMEDQGRRGALCQNLQAPGWSDYIIADEAYRQALVHFETWIDAQEIAK